MRLSPAPLVAAVWLGGFAALGWESIWQLKAALAIGVSSQATAVVISATMGGMAAGTLLAGSLLQRFGDRYSPFVLYGAIELFIGLCGLAMPYEFAMVSQLDVAAFQAGGSSSLLLGALIALTLCPPSMAMGKVSSTRPKMLSRGSRRPIRAHSRPPANIAV